VIDSKGTSFSSGAGLPALMSSTTSKAALACYVYAVGGNPRAALASGVDHSRIIIKAFLLNGVLCAIAGVVLMSRINSGQPVRGRRI
jgi:ribose/xylose/arabinose/galactoside ABC-type transport system permease subunit